jgi:hypothetical protein
MYLGHELRYPLRDVKRFLFDLSKLLKFSAVLMASQTNIQAGHPGKSYLARDSILVLFLSVFSYDYVRVLSRSLSCSNSTHPEQPAPAAWWSKSISVTVTSILSSFLIDIFWSVICVR